MEIVRPLFSDKNVAVRKCFLKAADNVLYHDAEFKKALTADEAVDVYLKGVVIVAADGSFSTPIGCAVASKKATLTYIKPNGTTATSADIGKATSV